MGWSASSRHDLRTFAALLTELKRARNPMKGRKVESTTRIHLLNGTIDDPKTIAVRLYNTDILKFNVDGSVDVAVHGWATSQTTNAHLNGYSGMSVNKYLIPSVNGYKTNPHEALFLSRWNTSPKVAYNTQGYKDIRITPSGLFDLSTVTPHKVHYVTEPAKLRKAMRHMKRICDVALGFAKLNGDNPFEKGRVSVASWLFARYGMPIEEIQLDPFPYIYLRYTKSAFGKDYTPTLKTAFYSTLKDIRFDIARREGWLGEHEVLKVE